MSESSQTKILVLVIGVVCIALAYVFVTGIQTILQPEPNISGFNDPREGEEHIASTTSTVLTWGAPPVRIVSSSSPPGTRTALTFKAIDCGTNGNVWINFEDKLAATSTTFLIGATTTQTMNADFPYTRGSITALASSANCRINVTEWRLPN